jgi:hypothetical protein
MRHSGRALWCVLMAQHSQSSTHCACKSRTYGTGRCSVQVMLHHCRVQVHLPPKHTIQIPVCCCVQPGLQELVHVWYALLLSHRCVEDPNRPELRQDALLSPLVHHDGYDGRRGCTAHTLGINETLCSAAGVGQEHGCNVVGPFDMLLEHRRAALDSSLSCCWTVLSVLSPHPVAVHLTGCRVARAAGAGPACVTLGTSTLALLRDATCVRTLSRVDMLWWHPSQPCATTASHETAGSATERAELEPQLQLFGYVTSFAAVSTDIETVSARCGGAGQKHASHHGGSRPFKASLWVEAAERRL